MVKSIEKAILSPVEKTADKEQILIPTGSVMLNLACSDRIEGGYGPGTVVNLIGDSSSGKTILALSMLAEMHQLPQFDHYRFIFDNAERGLAFDMSHLFGPTFGKRINDSLTKQESVRWPSNTIEDFYGNVLRALAKDSPCIYILDSFDSISADAEISRSKEYKNDKTDKSGSYKTEKPRMASEILRVINGMVDETASIVLIISQTRDNIGFGAQFNPTVRSGGRALKFYCFHEIWLAMGKKLISRELEIGADVFAKVSKNKLTGKKRETDFPVYYDYGVDNLRSCIDFLLAQEVWKKVKQSIDSGDLFTTATMKTLIKEIEERDMEHELFQLVQTTWTNREEAVKLKRKRKYA